MWRRCDGSDTGVKAEIFSLVDKKNERDKCSYCLLTKLGRDVSRTSHLLSFKSSPPDQTVLRSQQSQLAIHGSKSCAFQDDDKCISLVAEGEMRASEPLEREVMMLGGRMQTMRGVEREAEG